MLNLDDFVFFTPGKTEIGIDTSLVENIYFSLNKTSIKKEYIAASTPKKIINYDQFSIQKTLLTVENFRKFVSETSYITESEKEGWGWVWNNGWLKKSKVSWEAPFMNEADLFYNMNSVNLPVMQISWNDAVEYTKWLSEEVGEYIRLPYEHEWEIFGNYAGLNSINSVFADSRIEIKSDNDFIMALKTSMLNSKFQLGLLWEWTLDWYTGYDDSTSNKDFGNIYKTLRGGSLMSENIQKSREFRFRRCPTARSPYYGFRIVIDGSKI